MEMSLVCPESFDRKYEKGIDRAIYGPETPEIGTPQSRQASA